jgi:hypothetical protein
MMSTKDFDLSTIEAQGSMGLDALFEREPQMVTPKTARRKVASIQDLAGFIRLSSDLLIHKADKDLWSIKKDADGTLFVERMFSDDTKPLK